VFGFGSANGFGEPVSSWIPGNRKLNDILLGFLRWPFPSFSSLDMPLLDPERLIKPCGSLLDRARLLESLEYIEPTLFCT